MTDAVSIASARRHHRLIADFEMNPSCFTADMDGPAGVGDAHAFYNLKSQPLPFPFPFP